MMLARRLVLAVLGWVLVAAGVGGVMAATVLAAGDANVERCPNDALQSFRVFLPDCRAYELVSPPYKQGYPVHIDATAESGVSLIGFSGGVFADAAGGPQLRNSIGIEYEFDRGPGGWRATSLSVQNPGFRGASTWYAVSSDVSRSLSSTPSAPAGQDDFYVRNPDGMFDDVGPATPPADGPTVVPASPGSGPELNNFPFEGASSDLSRLVYEIEGGFIWPGDNTAGPPAKNLYEYVGTGNSTPLMVGVSGGNGSTSLIGECGVLLGGPQSRFDAVSADGATVFFTPVGADERNCGKPQPAVEALFARLNESATVQLSSSSSVDCTTPACQSAPAADALFEGASLDGSEAFFASTQQLTDGASEDAEVGDGANVEHGSGCPQAHESGCNLYEYDFDNPAGENLVLVSGGSSTPHVQGVVRISQDGSCVYFVAQGVLTSTPNSQGQTAQAGANNMYVFERDAQFPAGRTRFIAGLAENDERLWGANRDSDSGRPAQTSPDGRFLVFQSHAQLTPEDTSSGVWQVFEYDSLTASLVRVSVGQDGFNENGNTSVDNATIPAPQYGSGHGGQTPQPLALSNDGSYVVFQSARGLTPQALDDVRIDEFGNKAINVYEYHDGEVYLISDGQDVTLAGNGTGSNVSLIGTSASGADVFFTAGDQLVGEDVDTQQDVYDARVDGGFASQQAPPGCQGDACQGPLGASPFLSLPSTGNQPGGGNLAVPASVSSKPSKTVAQVRAEKLVKALKSCRGKHNRHKRAVCEAQARKRYGSRSKAKRSAAAHRRAGR